MIEIEVTILKWEKFNPRKDVKASSWFRLQHDLFEHPEFCQFTHSELCFWIYLLCLCSRKNTQTVIVYAVHAERIGRFNKQTVFSALEKLNDIQVVTYKRVTRAVRRRYSGVTHTNATNDTDVRDVRDVRDDTDTGGTQVTVENKLPELALIWNELTDPKLPRVIEMAQNTRRRKNIEQAWKEKPEKDYWVSIINKINQTPFLLGNGTEGWKANLEWIASIGNREKLLAGYYDSQKGNGIHPITKAQKIEDQNRLFMEKFIQEQTNETPN